MKARTGYKHWANQFGGHQGECTFCGGVRLFTDSTEADEWWAIHEVSTVHVDMVARRRGKR